MSLRYNYLHVGNYLNYNGLLSLTSSEVTSSYISKNMILGTLWVETASHLPKFVLLFLHNNQIGAGYLVA